MTAPVRYFVSGAPPGTAPLRLRNSLVPSGRTKFRPTALFEPSLALTFNQKLRSNLNCILRHAEPDQCVWAAAFDHPFGHRSVGVFHIEMEPRVRIDHFPFTQCALQCERFVDVKFCGKRVMSP